MLISVHRNTKVNINTNLIIKIKTNQASTIKIIITIITKESQLRNMNKKTNTKKQINKGLLLKGLKWILHLYFYKSY